MNVPLYIPSKYIPARYVMSRVFWSKWEWDQFDLNILITPNSTIGIVLSAANFNDSNGERLRRK